MSNQSNETYIQPILANEHYTKINNSVVTGNAVADALQILQGSLGVKTLFTDSDVDSGEVGLFQILDQNGNTTVLRPGDIVMSTTVVGKGPIIGPNPTGTQVTVGLGPSSTGPIVNVLYGPTGSVTVNQGTSDSLDFEVVSPNVWPVVEITDFGVTSGNIDVRFNTIPLQL